MIDTLTDISRAAKAVRTILPIDADTSYRRYHYLVTDSRSVSEPASTIFVALRTEIGDGHKFINELYSKGVRAFIVEREVDSLSMPDAAFIVVDSAKDALAGIAKARLDGFKNGIVITGSCGKSKVKELLFCALCGYVDIARSPRSWNSSIGVPLAVWRMTEPSQPDYMLTEVGIDGPGQGDAMHALLAGSHGIGIITPITDEHDENFASHTDKINEKIAIVRDCHTIFYADSDPELVSALNALKSRRRDLALIPVTQGFFPTIFHAIADVVVTSLALPHADVKSLPLVDMRREIQSGLYNHTVIGDYATADYESLRDALDFMRRQGAENDRLVLILGRLMHGRSQNVVDLMRQARDMAKEYGICDVRIIDSDAAASRFIESYHLENPYPDARLLLFGLPRSFADGLCSAGHDTVLEVDLDAVVHNYNSYRRLLPAGTGMVGMVKASAYGMGAVEIGRTLQSQGAAYLAVAVVDEAIALRKAGVTMPIMVLNPVTDQCPALFSNRIEPAVFSIDELSLLEKTARENGQKDCPIHIKLDTGMHRVGFTEDQLDGLIDWLQRDASRLVVASVFSHLATADCLDLDEYTHMQIDTFHRMTEKLGNALGYSFRRHILNTAGMMRFADCGHYEMARLGIGLYGISPLPWEPKDGLRTVATFKTRIISLKHLPAGTPVGYGCRGGTERESIIATVPAGYADGINRRLGRGNVSFMVRGVACPTIGNICMDLCMVDVTGVPGVAIGDEVEIFGLSVPVGHLADVLGTIPYEVFTWVSPRVRRIYYRR